MNEVKDAGELFLGLFTPEEPAVSSALRAQLKIPLKPELSRLAAVSWLSRPALLAHEQRHRGAPGKPVQANALCCGCGGTRGRGTVAAGTWGW